MKLTRDKVLWWIMLSFPFMSIVYKIAVHDIIDLDLVLTLSLILLYFSFGKGEDLDK